MHFIFDRRVNFLAENLNSDDDNLLEKKFFEKSFFIYSGDRMFNA